MPEIEPERIVSRDELHSVAYKWSVNRQLDPVLYRKVVDNLFPDSDLPTYAHIVETSLLHFEGRKSEQIRACEEVSRFFVQIGATWSLETMRHLFLLNAAGLAGAITLYTQSRIDDSFSASSAAMFAIGIGLSLLGLWAGSKSFLLQAAAHTELLQPLRRASSWEGLATVYSEAKGFQGKMKRSEQFAVTGNLAGWASAIVAIAALVIMGAGLWIAPSI